MLERIKRQNGGGSVQPRRASPFILKKRKSMIRVWFDKDVESSQEVPHTDLVSEVGMPNDEDKNNKT